MNIKLISLHEHDGKIHARAQATAAQARIDLEVWFGVQDGLTQYELVEVAKDHVLRYLDPA